MRCWSIAGADGNALDGKYRTAKHLEVPEHLEAEATTDLASSSKIDVRNLEKRRLCGRSNDQRVISMHPQVKVPGELG